MITAGRLLYLTYHLPLAEIRRSRREGGPWQQWITRRGRRAMEAATCRLAPIAVPTRRGDELALVAMTGRALWYQTAFCLQSFFLHTTTRLPIRFIDDGTLTRLQADQLLTLFPGSTLESAAAASSAADRRIPAERFPRLRAHERTFILLRKLTFVHGGGRGWQLFFDADMLFHHQPNALERWCARPERPVFMTDLHNAYGYPLPIVNAFAAAPVPERLNTGVSGLHADAIDWAQLEFALAGLLDRHGSSYYLEQALFAIALAGKPYVALPPEDYIVMPPESEIHACRAVLHHYVDLSKRGYFRHAWRHAMHA